MSLVIQSTTMSIYQTGERNFSRRKSHKQKKNFMLLLRKLQMTALIKKLREGLQLLL